MTIQEIKTRLKTELLANIYISKEFKQIIVAPNHKNEAGIYYEQEQVVVLAYDAHVETLGETTRKALEAFSFKDINLRGRKSTDWPAYKASKAKSVKAFERGFVFISAKTQGTSVLLSGHPVHNSEIFISKYASPYFEIKFGNDIIDVYRCCRHLSETYFA